MPRFMHPGCGEPTRSNLRRVVCRARLIQSVQEHFRVEVLFFARGHVDPSSAPHSVNHGENIAQWLADAALPNRHNETAA
jgi:hypothetical protein